MKTVFKLLLLTAMFLSHSCKDDDEQLSLNASIIFTSIVCYPNDSISTTFIIVATGGKSPYIFNWTHPESFVGEGPFTMNITSNTMLTLEVVDANNAKLDFQYEILKDTIDPSKYDYRNAFTGFYNCEVKYQRVVDSSGIWVTRRSTYNDTIEVKKHSDFQRIIVSDWLPDLNFNYRDSTFSGYHTYGKFENDSITFSYYQTPVAMYSWHYSGGKIKQ